MPEFERKKRKRISNQQLFEEYYDTDKKKSVKSSSKGKKKLSGNKKSRTKSKPVKRENPPVSPERQRIKKQYPKDNTTGSDRKQPKKKSAAKKGKKNTVNKKRRHGSYALYYFLCGILVVAVVAILSVTVLFNINRYEIIGDTQYSDEEIINASGIKTGENLLRTDIGKAEEDIISKLVYINNVKIKRGFPDKLIINVEPAVPLASFYISGKYYLISETGKILEISDKRFDLPVIKGYTLNTEKEEDSETEIKIGASLKDDDEKRVTAALNIMEYMKQCGLDEDFTIDLTDILSIKLLYDNRIEMQLGTTAAMDEKILNASLLILDHNEIAENEKCVLILTNPYHVPKQPIREQQKEEYAVTTEELSDDISEENPEEGSDENSEENAEF